MRTPVATGSFRAIVAPIRLPVMCARCAQSLESSVPSVTCQLRRRHHLADVTSLQEEYNLSYMSVRKQKYYHTNQRQFHTYRVISNLSRYDLV